MGYYKKQFIEDITNHLDPKLAMYYNERIGSSYSLTEFTEQILNEYFEGKSTKSELSAIIEKVKNTRKSRRKRWYDRIINDSKSMNIDDTKHPFKTILNYAKSLNMEKCVEQFGTYKMEEIVQKELNKVEEWKKNSNSYFIEFPVLSVFTPNQKLNAFKIDMILNIWNQINKSLNGNISSFEKQYPIAFIDKPLFAPSSFQLFMNDASSDLLQEIILDENGNEIMDISVKKGKLIPPKSMTADEQMLINIFIHNAYADPKEFVKTRTLNIDLVTVANQMVSYIPGSRIKDKIEKCCERLVQYSYTYYDNADGKMYFNLFDNIRIIFEGEKPTIQCMYGDVLFNAIIQKQLISIIAPHYEMLKNPLSKIICFALKKEQIIFQNEPRTEEYTYTFFQKIVRFKLKEKRTNINLIKESLQDFIDNKIIVENYKYENDSFFITYLPLTSYELEDLQETKRLD